MESKSIMVKNARVKWAKVHRPDNTFPPARWSVDVYPNAEGMKEILAVVEALREPGDKNAFRIKGEDERFFTAKRNEKTHKGDAKTPPRVVDANRQPFAENIGNGSVCNVIVSFYHYDTFGGGVGCELEAVQVINHVPYKQGDSVDFEATDQQPKSAFGSDDNLPF